MSSRAFATAAALATAFTCLPAAAQSRPDEEALFGGEEPPQTPAAAAQEPPPAPESVPSGPPPSGQPPSQEASRDAQALTGGLVQEAFGTEGHADDPLKIGGQFYLRAFTQGNEGVSFGDTSFSAPTLVDGYFDARPTDRLRGMVVGRLSFDPSRAGQSTSFLGTNPSDGTPTIPGTSFPNPRVLLDQAWLRFDIAHTVFVTAGKQHVKWGTSRFWNPTDFLSPQRRDPLAVFDARTGASMVKLHVPWEATGWNFYGIALLDNAGPATSLGRIGGAARAEVVLGPAEFGASAVLQRGRKPRFGIDVSSAAGPFDVYGELALTKGFETPRFLVPDGLTFEEIIAGAGGLEIRNLEDLGKLPLPSESPEHLTPQVSGGANYTFAYSESDTATVGVEYFYNATGYDASTLYPYLIARGQYQPFYLGKHYAAVYATLIGPGSWDKASFILSNIGNLSDRSFTSRLDLGYRALSYLSVEAYGAASYGHKGGEFRFALDTGPFLVDGRPLVPAPTFQLGVGLRINL
ncbi:hypothetical protein POL68_09060 [Stigmatella sp. ncwal1]|uniref:Porin n=1 Tax=Stigmatella ashevillensis TaxID=2995309 RepID=A0ABT5D4M5_9BACT|nr:hypothetical protein [Stigmatella ashevillena]MDC0708615.1 hypothetical protein [Stigmatella ashevillena]